jgi:hypothetical protein
MLITFSTPVYSDITMFGGVAVHLLKLMGHSGTVPGALSKEDVEPALERLQAAVAASGDLPEEGTPDQQGDEEESVSLSQRAWPLIQLLKAAAKAQSYVMWEGKGQ